IPGSEKRFQIKLRRAEKAYEAVASVYAAYEAECAREQAEVEAEHRAVDLAYAAYGNGDPATVVDYFTLALKADPLPEDFPRAVRVGYIPESRQLVVEQQLPTI